MRQIMKGLFYLVVLTEVFSWSGKASGQSSGTPVASIEGRITTVEATSHTVGAHPLRNLTVYLFNLDQSKPLQELQRKCRKATANPGRDSATAFAAYNVCVTSLAEAVDVVPHLTPTASTRTDEDGKYKFENVPPALRYQVVAVKVEDGEPIVIVGLSPKLKPGQHVTIDLRDNDPWTNADPR